MRSRVLWACLLLLGVAQAQEEQPQGDKRSGGVVALVEGEPITRYELDLSCRLEPGFRDLTVGSTRWRKAVAEQLRFLIEQRLIVQKARGAKVELTASDQRFLEGELLRRAQSVGGMAAYRQSIEEQLGVPYDYYVARHKASLLRQKLLSKNVSQDIFVSPDEVRRYYQLNLSRWNRKGETRVRQIVAYPTIKESVRQPPGFKKWLEENKTWDPQVYIAALRKRLLAGERFADLAKDYSLGPKATEEIKIPSSQSLHLSFNPPLGSRIERLVPGEISEPVTTEVDHGTYLVILIDRRPPGPLPLTQVQGQIERELKIAVRKQREEVYLTKLREEATVRVYLSLE